MEKVTPTYFCDAPDCRSRCTLDPAEADPDRALAARGWRVATRDGAKTHLCPAHADEAAEPADAG